MGFSYRVSSHNNKNMKQPVAQLSIKGGFFEQMRILGTLRPPRLLLGWMTKVHLNRRRFESRGVSVSSVKRIGRGEIVLLGTTSKTYIAEGLVAHNTILKMAEKRAFVAAVLIATNTSDMYTQDLEDSPEESENSKGAGIPRSASKPTNADGKPDDSGMDENARITPEMLAYFDKVRSSLGRRTDKAGDETIARFLSRGPNKQEIQTAADMTVKTYRYVLGHMEQNPNAWKIRPKPGSKA